MSIQLLALVAVLLGSGFALAASPAKLPHSHIALGSGQIEQVMLVEPTRRYDHFVLGDPFEAAGFQVTYRGGQKVQYTLSPRQVFEDRMPRLYDLTGDGREELVLVLSQIDHGASLAVFDLAPDKISLLAQTPFIGQANRWLNPAGIADFDGDGLIEIAVVAKPHLSKELQFWRFSGDGLALISRHQGFSNHRLGSREQRMSAVLDYDNDGRMDLLLPGPDRKSLHVISLARGFETLHQQALEAEIEGPVMHEQRGIVVPLRNGVNFVLPRP